MQFGLDPDSGGAGPAQMSRKRKAALIVQLLLEDGNKLGLNALPEHLQEELTHELAAIRLVDRDTVEAVAAEFVTILESIGLSGKGDPGAALAVLADHISPELAARLKAQIDLANGVDPWPPVLDLDPQALTRLMGSESIEVAAIVLSKLPVGKAAAVLGNLPGDRARRITFAVSRTEKIRPQIVHRIGVALAAEYCRPAPVAFDKGPDARLGAILNSTLAATREDVLESLEADDAEFARDVRRAIFTFKDIPARIKPRDLPNLMRVIDNEALVTAIGAALQGSDEEAKAAKFIFENITQRMADQYREEAEALGKVRRSTGEEAMNTVTATIRDQVDAGALSLIDPDAEAEDDASEATPDAA